MFIMLFYDTCSLARNIFGASRGIFCDSMSTFDLVMAGHRSISPVPVAQLVERWTPCGESTRPGYESPRVRGATGA